MNSKKLLYVYLLLLSVAIFVMVLLWNAINYKNIPCNERDFPQIAASGILNVATDHYSFPYFISGSDFRREMLRAWEAEWGIRVNIFVDDYYPNNLNRLLTRHFDLVALTIPAYAVSQLIDSSVNEFAFTSIDSWVVRSHSPVLLDSLNVLMRRIRE